MLLIGNGSFGELSIILRVTMVCVFFHIIYVIISLPGLIAPEFPVSMTLIVYPHCNFSCTKMRAVCLHLPTVFTDNLITLMIICWFVGFPLLPEGRSARFVLMSEGNCVQPGPESLRLVVQRQVLTRRNKQLASSSSLLIWKAAAAVVLTCYRLLQLDIRKGE